MEINVSDDVYEEVLFQLDHEDTLRSIAYFSKRHTSIKSNYEIYDKELMVIIRAFEEWRLELKEFSKLIDVIIDHRNLKYFMSFKWLSRRQTR